MVHVAGDLVFIHPFGDSKSAFHAWCPKSTKNMGLFGGGLQPTCLIMLCGDGSSYLCIYHMTGEKNKTSSYTSSDFAYRLGTRVLTHGIDGSICGFNLEKCVNCGILLARKHGGCVWKG